MSGVAVLDTTQCALGEGPLRHPGRQQFFWFDINAHRLYTRENDEARSWQFDEYVSAAEWVDAEQLIIASETALSLFDLRTGAQDRHCAVEADDPRSRNNDCRADPQGGFWIGTMCIDKEPEHEAGAIWRCCRGELRQPYPGITISKAICYRALGRSDPFHRHAKGQYLTAKARRPRLTHGCAGGVSRLARRALPPGWGCGGCCGRSLDRAIWPRQGGPLQRSGRHTSDHRHPGGCTTCPAFGGQDLRSMLVTTLRQNLTDPDPAKGQTFILTPGPRASRASGDLMKQHFLSVGERMVEMVQTAPDTYRRGFTSDTFNTECYARRRLPDDWSVGYLSATGTDAVSVEMRAFVAASGIETQVLQAMQDRTMGLYMISTVAGERSFSYWRSQSVARLLAEDAACLGHRLEQAGVIHFSGITLAILSPEHRQQLCGGRSAKCVRQASWSPLIPTRAPGFGRMRTQCARK